MVEMRRLKFTRNLESCTVELHSYLWTGKIKGPIINDAPCGIRNDIYGPQVQ